MIRALIGVLIAVIAAAFIRGVIGMITREMGQMMNADKQGGQTPPDPAPPPNASTALQKCTVCGTYTPSDRMLEGQFCSQACRERAHAT